MRICLIILILVALSAVGCRNRAHQDRYIDSLIAETRFYESQLYELKHEYKKLERELERTRNENGVGSTSSSRPNSRSGSGGTGDNGIGDSGGNRDPLAPPDIDTGTPMNESPPNGDTSPPMIEIPGLDDGNNNGGGDAGPQPFVPPPIDFDASTGESDGPELIPAPLPTDEAYIPDNEITDFQVEDVVVHQSHTRGVNTNREPGDDAIALLVQPRNRANQVIEDWERISVVMIDPALPGEQARVARWELTPEKSKPWLLDARPAAGVKFLLPWPDGPPLNNRMKLFVRYHTKDNRKLIAESDMHITLAGDVSDRWTPRINESAPGGGSQMANQPQPRSAERIAPGMADDFPEWRPNR
jgi:hypothetical protein